MGLSNSCAQEEDEREPDFHDEEACPVEKAFEEEAFEECALPAGSQLSVMMFGMSGAGKSSLGNLIAGSNVFVTGDNTMSVTNMDSVMSYAAEDDSMMLLDTIGLGDTEIDQEKVVMHLRDAALSAPNGIDVLLLVLRGTRITDDTISRIDYATNFLWGNQCLLNLYVVITFASPKYVANEEAATAWIEKQIELNWRFEYIYKLVGNPKRFIFVDNPDPDSMEPEWAQRRRVSRNAVMQALCAHPKGAVPAFKTGMMQKAQELLKDESKQLEEKKNKLQKVKRKTSVSRLPGRTCRIVSLGDGNDPSFVGMVGILEHWDASTGCWSMVLEDGRKTNIRMEHLKLQRETRVAKSEAFVSQEVEDAQKEKDAAEQAISKKKAEVKNDHSFNESARRESQEAASRFRDSLEANGESERTLPVDASMKLTSTLLKEDKPASKKGTNRKKKAAEKSEQSEGREIEEILVRVRDKIVKAWKSNPAEIFGHLTLKDQSWIFPWSFKMFLQSAEPGILDVAIGVLWRRADINCDGKIDSREFEDFLK